ncbi:UPF0547 protein C16orf87 homolog [Amphibalanus amphitrite]|uniref:UPF0547 protein C16orf87 homolog n=1 Tax=Amphibalanus amphitrite TaxID=1232801 RepID=UPI001C92AC78|nr:UPF0547 protein C16orf87 homolog [Amphibalanus amphitrite]XP_043188781.1 UPF0547 protein C16orf87 homolog [Amphibalanus amphitrite]XP_043188792.1 UPF0547 protein C16orf87 homolog [Amphibalanus amphitrite]XP_043224706.1 UPF0547 protein C16orf87 homolog [Amphibalanus amphitrite]XP_043224707.1 UPF0547 protein C16orf87 homolog [Amphibalanus amphitrite]XP_043224708.1 UPF0547 protein C16orf87 homolog [Amphibalanus amphitrite]XP_043224710.1 UPF0547 protein C16orf87 homolog [Amphibalanus amphitrit
MPKKSVTKECPGCERQLPVACKTCPCGHSFRKSSDSTVSSAAPVGSPGRAPGAAKEGESPARRRTERVKREKPKFYDASQYERAPRKRKPKPVEPDTKKVRIDERRSLKEKVKEEREEVNGGGGAGAGDEQEMVYEDIMADATREETAKYAIVLSEINRKLCVVNPTF